MVGIEINRRFRTIVATSFYEEIGTILEDLPRCVNCDVMKWQ